MQHTIAVDLSKNVFQVAESEHPGKVSRKRRLTHGQFERYLGACPPSRFVLEACGSAHHWGREIQSKGHTVKLLPPHHVRRYRAGDKTDATDAKALLEADRNEAIHEVPVKSTDQECLAALHRLRAGYMTTRTARLNAARGVLREFGINIPVGAKHVAPAVLALEEGAVPVPVRVVLQGMVEEVYGLEDRIASIEHQLEGLVEQTPLAQYPLTIPGVGLLTATALVGFVGDFRRFPSGRHLAAYLGLTPREHSSGEKRRLGGISKRGDTYLRTLLIHGARTVLMWAGKRKTQRATDQWMIELLRRRGRNIAAVAVANKMARWVWVVATEHREFRR